MIGVILAGGLSSRMQQDKANMPHPVYSHQSMLDYAMKILLELGCEKVVLSGENVDGVTDSHYRKGPLGGIYSVLSEVSHTQYLIIPVDMPLLDRNLLARLVEQQSDAEQSVYFDNAPFPMLLSVNDSMREYLLKVLTLESADRSIKTFLSSIGARAIRCPSPRKLINTNTPKEWQLIKQTEQHIENE